ncbi:MAG TPA: hypothetical protein VNM43_06935 [Dehalococcoidia bacterium]|nr:hypothetical protein [Dehalococcoidia bacterium]
MTTAPRTRFVPPRDPDAEPVCRLTREEALRRREPPDRLLSEAIERDCEHCLENGAEYRFPGGDDMWERVSVFVDEERECCPFFAFEQREEGDTIVLRIFWPRAGSD